MRDRWLWFWGLVITLGYGVAIFKVPGAYEKTEIWLHALGNLKIVIWGAALLVIPGFLVVWFVWCGILRQDINDFTHMPPLIGVPVMVFVVIFSWIFWSTAWSRFFLFIGRWDPFHYRSGKPWILRSLVIPASGVRRPVDGLD